MVIATGVAVFTFQGTGNDFIRDAVRIPTGIFINDPSTFRGAGAIAALASVANDGVANNAVVEVAAKLVDTRTGILLWEGHGPEQRGTKVEHSQSPLPGST